MESPPQTQCNPIILVTDPKRITRKYRGNGVNAETPFVYWRIEIKENVSREGVCG